MTTEQNNTAALTDEQLEEVAGGMRMRGRFRSTDTKYVNGTAPVDRILTGAPLTHIFKPRPGVGYIGVVNEDGPVW